MPRNAAPPGARRRRTEATAPISRAGESGCPPSRIEQRNRPSSPYLEHARRRRPRTEAADRDADAIVRDAARPPGRAAGTSLGEYGVALGGTQGITAPLGGRRGRGHRVACDVGPLRRGLELWARRRRVMTREAERAERREHPVHRSPPRTPRRHYRGQRTAS